MLGVILGTVEGKIEGTVTIEGTIEGTVTVDGTIKGVGTIEGTNALVGLILGDKALPVSKDGIIDTARPLPTPAPLLVGVIPNVVSIVLPLPNPDISGVIETTLGRAALLPVLLAALPKIAVAISPAGSNGKSTA